ncbi:MAG: peptide-methionine (S)-S-oxide reductase MsrA [Chloroflexi bacterium]|nr:peptide-methionine (S)-S-oxide reductase MsrA [Chloroflexota bacterium]
MQLQTATLGGGCFWCLEAVYELVNGVESVVSGYAGGHVVNPSYEQVCTGTTGHAEVTQVTYNPSVVSLSHILDIFFTIHDPTTLNRQGYDVGPQYRSIILYHDDEQKAEAEAAIKRVSEQGLYRDPLVTQVEPLDIFYQAESYHQEYFRSNPGASYCQVIIEPKVAKFREKYLADLRV